MSGGGLEGLAKGGATEDPLGERRMVWSIRARLGRDRFVIEGPKIVGQVADQDRHVEGPVDADVGGGGQLTVVGDGPQGAGHLIDLVDPGSRRPEQGPAPSRSGLGRPRGQPSHLRRQPIGYRFQLRGRDAQRAAPGRRPGLLRGFERVVLDRRFSGRTDQGEGGSQDIGLKPGIGRRTERTTEGEGNPEGPGRTNRLALLSDQADGGGGDAGAFDGIGEGADRARADRSNRDQEGEIDIVGGEEPTDFLPGDGEGFMVRLCPHEAVVPAGDATDLTTGLEFA